MFLLQEAPIDYVPLKNARIAGHIGALVSFEGIVRADELQGGKVSAIMYVADASACLKEGEQILKEAKEQFPIVDAVCVQRIGKINVGEAAIWVGVWAAHRDESFKGCRFVIEEVKKRLLIWKKEFLINGDSQWIYGPQTPRIT